MKGKVKKGGANEGKGKEGKMNTKEMINGNGKRRNKLREREVRRNIEANGKEGAANE